jgi:hypothetical protein
MRGRHHAVRQVWNRARRISKKLQNQHRYDPKRDSNPNSTQEMNCARKREREQNPAPALPRNQWMRHIKQMGFQQPG